MWPGDEFIELMFSSSVPMCVNIQYVNNAKCYTRLGEFDDEITYRIVTPVQRIIPDDTSLASVVNSYHFQGII